MVESDVKSISLTLTKKEYFTKTKIFFLHFIYNYKFVFILLYSLALPRNIYIDPVYTV